MQRTCSKQRQLQAAGRASCFVSSKGRLPRCNGKRASQHSGRCQRQKLTVRAGPVEIDDEDLLQVKDRNKWYEARFCAEDQPEWTIGRFISSRQESPEYRAVTVECEISRERVALRNAYKHVGQRAAVRINSGVERHVTVASSPFPLYLNKDPLFKVRGDLFANEVKTGPREPISVMAEMTLLVTKKEAPELFNMGPDDVVEVGPFKGTGLDLRTSPIMAIYRCPTVVLFVEGRGVATAKSLLEATPDVVDLVQFRKDVRMYYKVPNASSICFKDVFEAWEQQMGVRVITTTSSFQDAWDEDDDLTYDPETTGAIIITGGDEEAEKAALELCKEAEISIIVTDSKEQQPVVHLDSNTFEDWMAGANKLQQRQQAAEAAAAAAAAVEAQAAEAAATAAKKGPGSRPGAKGRAPAAGGKAR